MNDCLGKENNLRDVLVWWDPVNDYYSLVLIFDEEKEKRFTCWIVVDSLCWFSDCQLNYNCFR
jgi:hypothetical protein